MIKFKCDFTGVESDWVETDTTPIGWGVMNVNFRSDYTIRLHACPDIVKNFHAKHQTSKNDARLTLAEMIEQHIQDIAHDAAQDAVANP